MDKIDEYIEMVNYGYIPVKFDSNKRFKDNTLIADFFIKYQDEILIRIKEISKDNQSSLILNLCTKKNKLDYTNTEYIIEYLDLLKQGYIPKIYDSNLFKDGTVIGYFFVENFKKLKSIANSLKTIKHYEKVILMLYDIDEIEYKKKYIKLKLRNCSLEELKLIKNLFLKFSRTKFNQDNLLKFLNRVIDIIKKEEGEKENEKKYR